MAVISISRQFGAGGRTAAVRVAELLGYEFADETLTARVAEAAGVSDEWVNVTEREGEGWRESWVSSLVSTKFLDKILGGGSVKGKKGQLINYFKEIIPKMAAKDNIVFLGRGSQFILPDDPNVIKILLVASKDYRINFMCENYRLNVKEARETIQEWERNRSDFLGSLTIKDPDDPSIYHLIFNSNQVHPTTAADMICEYVRMHESGGASG